MVLSSNLVSAAAGLIGAVIGGASTYLANRVQWRRESRRTAYANLISSAYRVETFIAGHRRTKGESVDPSIKSTDPRTEFYSQLDSAILLAKWKTQGALHKWRELYPTLEELVGLSEPDRVQLLVTWQERQNEFYDFAKDELGVQGRYSYRRALIGYILTTAFVMAIAAIIQPDESGNTTVGVIRWILILGSIVLLIFAFQAALRWRLAVEHSQGRLDLRRPDVFVQYFRMVDILQVAIVIAFLCTFIVFSFESSEVSATFGEVGYYVLLLGGGAQIMFMGHSFRAIYKSFRR